MLKVYITILLFVNGLDSLGLESLLDTIGSQIYRIGDPDHLHHEDVNALKNICETYGDTELNKEKDKILVLFEGLGKKLAEVITPKLTQEARESCMLLKNGEGEKAVRVGKLMNKKVLDAQKLRFGLQTVLSEAMKPETKATFAQISCHIKEYTKKLTELFSDNEETKWYVSQTNANLFGRIAEAIDKEKGKEETTCELPTATSNPSQFKSLFVPILKAIENLEKK